jgi:hypothetical protein
MMLDSFVIANIVFMPDAAAWQKVILIVAIIAAYFAFFTVQAFGDTIIKRIVGRIVFYTLQIGVIVMAVGGGAWFVAISAIISLAFKTFFTIFSAPKS